MTNHTLPDHGAALNPELLALAPVGGTRRPAKIVEHPAFRAARARLAATPTFTVVRLPVVSLNRTAVPRAAACPAATSLFEAA